MEKYRIVFIPIGIMILLQSRDDLVPTITNGFRNKPTIKYGSRHPVFYLDYFLFFLVEIEKYVLSARSYGVGA